MNLLPQYNKTKAIILEKALVQRKRKQDPHYKQKNHNSLIYTKQAPSVMLMFHNSNSKDMYKLRAYIISKKR